MIRQFFTLFRRNETGATAVEFAIVLPIMLVTFGAIVESGRIFWNYQSAVAGVRDAARFMGRTTPEQVCTSATTSWAKVNADYKVYTVSGDSELTLAAAAESIILRNVAKDTKYTETQTAATLPTYVSLGPDSVEVEYLCKSGSYRTPFVPIVRVSADLVIALPFATLFTFFGNETGTLTTTVADQTRVMGV